jgi:hypothetical protein
MKFIMTVDTEADDQWDHGRELTTKNIKFIPPFQELCDKFFIKPTYLVTTEVCDDLYAKEIFSKYLLADKVEIGAHLHSWTTPPFIDEEGLTFNDIDHAYASELSEDLLREKIHNLTNHIEESFGKRPLSFRSGRFGFNETVAKILMENSYLVDSSVTPYLNWNSSKGIKDGNGGPDFIGMTSFPSRYPSNGSYLTEIPITILPTKFPLNKNNPISRYYFKNVERNLILKAIRKVLYAHQPLWLRPFEWMSEDLFEELINEAIRIGLPFIVMMFHSSELMPGASLYRKDMDSINRLYYQLEALFTALKERQIASLRLTEAVNEMQRGNQNK